MKLNQISIFLQSKNVTRRHDFKTCNIKTDGIGLDYCSNTFNLRKLEPQLHISIVVRYADFGRSISHSVDRRRGGLMVGALDSGSSGPVRALAGDIVLCSWALYSDSASLHPGVQMGSGEINAGRLPCNGLAPHQGSSRGEGTHDEPQERLRGRLRPGGPLGSYANFISSLPFLYFPLYNKGFADITKLSKRMT